MGCHAIHPGSLRTDVYAAVILDAEKLVLRGHRRPLPGHVGLSHSMFFFGEVPAAQVLQSLPMSSVAVGIGLTVKGFRPPSVITFVCRALPGWCTRDSGHCSTP